MKCINSLSRFAKIVVFAVCFIQFNSCSESPETLVPIQVDPAFSSYVISFTSGVVSNQSSIEVRFVQEFDNVTVGEELDTNPFSCSPSIDGKAVWKDAQTIAFVPEELLPSGAIYTVTCDVDKLIEVPDNLSELQFRFQVMHQDMEFEFAGFESYSAEDYSLQKVHGIFQTADYVPVDVFEQSLSVSVPGGKAAVSITSEDGKLFRFSLDSVPRNTEEYTISLECDGTVFGAEETKTFRVTIPAIDDFSVVRVASQTNPNTLLTVFFSDPLNPNQVSHKDFFALSKSNFKLVVDGSVAKMYPTQSLQGEVTLEVMESLQNSKGKKLAKRYEHKTEFVSHKPQVELVGDGIIIPNTDGIMFPFKAVSLSAVDVKIIQIFENNITQFLQVNQFDGNREIARVGRVVYHNEVPLTSDKSIDYAEWNTFYLDLSHLIQTQPGAIYQVHIGFSKKHSLYACSESETEDEEYYEESLDENADFDGPSSGYSYHHGNYGRHYSWRDRNNPCKPSYYMRNNHSVSRNVLASDFGIIAKTGSNGAYHVVVTDLRTAEPLSGIEIELRNYQNQPLASSETNAEGMAVIQTQNKPFILIAKKGEQRGYLRLDNASSLSLSMFNVQGQELNKGIKGFIYGERGVWRPGDSLFVTFILEDKNNTLPPNHPVVFELYTPENQLAERIVKSKNLNGFYTFFIDTDEDDPTGTWNAKVKVGGSEFSKSLKIETVKPNRMKIVYDISSDEIIPARESKTVNLQVDWLHGAPAQNAKVTIDATMRAARTSFKGYDGYVFDNPAAEFNSQEYSLFSGRVNQKGHTSVNLAFQETNNAPGMVNVQLKTRAYDAGGDFSTDRFVVKYSPYTSYVGLKMPEGSGWNNALYSNESNIVPIALVDQFGKPMNGTVKIEVFSIYWRYWWDKSEEDNLANYISNRYRNLLLTETAEVKDGKLMFDMNLDVESWGRKFIQITDVESGHRAGETFYTTYKGWWSNAGSENPGGAEMLQFSVDKESYEVGELISIQLPEIKTGRALVSIENGSKVLQTLWVDTKESQSFTIEASSEMSPNAFIHISYIQPHNQSENQLPIRMYGIENVRVEDSQTHVTPEISMKDELQPEQDFSVQVSEKSGKNMTYTIAIVDDGLLDLTRFKTPNPWYTFYSKEALGVRTWDMYKYVSGAFEGTLAGLLQLGGDEFLEKKDGSETNRFKPVVMVLGPFELDENKTNTHNFTMPNYVGSVRCMVVAGEDGAYGSAEKTVPVRKSLMVLPTIPRLVSPTETISIPVTVFAMNDKVSQVSVSLKTDTHFSVIGAEKHMVTFDTPGEKVVQFEVKVHDVVGKGKIDVVATSGKEKATSETHLEVRMPNPVTSRVIQTLVKPGDTWKQEVKAFGISGTNAGAIELSIIKPIDLQKRLQFLIKYPHGCIEQTTSGIFPQLFLSSVVNLSDSQQEEVSYNVREGIERLRKFQLSGGGFSYWPGGNYVTEWGTNYAGHFLIAAKNKGYTIPSSLLDNLIAYQTRQANSWRVGDQSYHNNDVTQAYRLYTLALAQKPARSAMNRMRESDGISNLALWRLAAAYAQSGKDKVAREIIAKIDDTETKQSHYAYTYGSRTRDKAMILETLVLLGELDVAHTFANELADKLSEDTWMSTQTTAYALLAMSQFMEQVGSKDNLKADIVLSGKELSVNTEKPVYQTELDFSQTKTYTVQVTNTSEVSQFVNVYLEGVPMMSDESAEFSDLNMTVAYFDMKGNPINQKNMKQGTDFYAEVTVRHPGMKNDYTDIALEQLFPSGWEIMNTRMDLVQTTVQADSPEYQDIRDDRVYSYFDLRRGQKKTFRILLHAAYTGKFYMPNLYCQPMYDNTVYAKIPGYWVEVTK
ncbi:MAG: alpha-2-macroglobulin family protein [Bacteroidales bacterium]